MQGASSRGVERWRAVSIGIALGIALAAVPALADFETDLARVDEAIRKNPSKVFGPALESCLSRRNLALRLYEAGLYPRAERSLKSCFSLLQIPEKLPGPKLVTAEELAAKAAREFDRAMSLEPDLARGLEIYRECAACHGAEGWGFGSGSVPQISAQHRKVVIKQLADIRAGNRDAVLMLPYASADRIGGAQGVADVAAYIDTLEMTPEPSKGDGKDLVLGEELYRANCVQCHGAKGEGDPELAVPRIQAQHYPYLLRQFEWIRDGKRRNSNPEMAKQIEGFGDRETRAVLDYVSRLEPPEELVAPPGWSDPDFAK